MLFLLVLGSTGASAGAAEDFSILLLRDSDVTGSSSAAGFSELVEEEEGG